MATSQDDLAWISTYPPFIIQPEPRKNDIFTYRSSNHYAHIHCAAHIITLAISRVLPFGACILRDRLPRGRNEENWQDGSKNGFDTWSRALFLYHHIADVQAEVDRIIAEDLLLVRDDEDLADAKGGVGFLDLRECWEARRGKCGWDVCGKERCVHAHVENTRQIGRVRVWMNLRELTVRFELLDLSGGSWMSSLTVRLQRSIWKRGVALPAQLL